VEIQANQMVVCQPKELISCNEDRSRLGMVSKLDYGKVNGSKIAHSNINSLPYIVC
jgi:hypothetical protein